MLRRHIIQSSNVSSKSVNHFTAIISLPTSSTRLLWFAPKPADHDNRLEKIAKTKWMWDNVNGPLKPHRGYSYDPSSFNRKEAEKEEKAANVGPDQLPLLRRLDDEKMKELELAKNLSFFNNRNRNEANGNNNNSSSPSLSHWKAISSSLESRKTPFSPIENCLQKFPSEIRRQRLEDASQTDANIIPTAIASGVISIFYLEQDFNIMNKNNSNNITQDQLNYTKFSQDLQLLELLCGIAWDILRQLLSPSTVRMPKKWKEAAITDFQTFSAELGNEFVKVMLKPQKTSVAVEMNNSASLIDILESCKSSVNASQMIRFQQDILHLVGNVRMVLHYSDQLGMQNENDDKAIIKNELLQSTHATILKLCRDQDESGGQDLVRDEMIFEFFVGKSDIVGDTNSIKSFHQKFIASVMHTEKTLDPENLDIVSLILQREFQQLHQNQIQNEETDSSPSSLLNNDEELRQNLASVMLAYAHSVQRFCRRVTQAHQEIQFASKNRGFGRTPVDGTVLKGIVRTLSTALDSSVIQEWTSTTGSNRVLEEESFPAAHQSSLLSSIERIILSLSEVFAIVPNFELPTEALIQLGENYGVFRQMLVMGRQINNNSPDDGTQRNEQRRSLYESTSNTFFQLTTIPVYKNLMINVLVRDETNFHLLRSECILSLLNSVLSNPECLNLVKTNATNNNEEEQQTDEPSNQQQKQQRQRQIEKNAARELRTKYSLLVRSCLKQINGIAFSSSSVLLVIYGLERIHSETFIEKFQSSVVKMDLATWRKLDTVLKEEILRQRQSDDADEHFGSLSERAREILNLTIRKYCVFDPVTKKHVV